MIDLNNKLKIGGKTVVHCPTEELANKVLSIADKLGYTWIDKVRYTENNNWIRNKECTCYNLFRGTYSNKVDYIEKGYDIISAEEFIKLHENIITMTPKEILINAIKECAVNRQNDNTPYIILVKTKDYGNYICFDEHTLLHDDRGYLKMVCYDDNLMVLSFDAYTIQEIWRVNLNDNIHKFDKYLFNNKLIWKREQIKEITLSEIAEKFGVDVNNIRIKE